MLSWTVQSWFLAFPIFPLQTPLCGFVLLFQAVAATFLTFWLGLLKFCKNPPADFLMCLPTFLCGWLSIQQRIRLALYINYRKRTSIRSALWNSTIVAFKSQGQLRKHKIKYMVYISLKCFSCYYLNSYNLLVPILLRLFCKLKDSYASLYYRNLKSRCRVKYIFSINVHLM